MIDIKELRLLNWVKYPNWHRDNKDAFFMCRELYLCDDKIGLTTGRIQTQVSLDSIKPIPLTEEWLIKFGLNKDQGIHNDNFSGLISVKYNGVLECYDVFIGTMQIRTIKHVHTLQNWWHSNTGEELKLKEEIK